MAPFDQGQWPENVPDWWRKKFMEIAKRIRAALARGGLTRDDYEIYVPRGLGGGFMLATPLVIWDQRHITVDLLVTCCELVEPEEDRWAIYIAVGERSTDAENTGILFTYDGIFLQLLMEDWVSNLITEAYMRMGKTNYISKGRLELYRKTKQ